MRTSRFLIAGLLALPLWLGCAASEGSTDEAATADTATPAPAQSAPATASDSLVTIADRARILGDSAAPVWVVIVSDFQCPYCKVWHDETFPALKREFVDRGRIRLAYLNLPLPQHQ